jgi:hypothetical protein
MDEARRCVSKAKQSQQRCKRAAIRGGNVCVIHGGGSPHVKLKAEQRLALMVDPLLTELYRIAMQGESDGVRLQAGKDLLDRAGLKPTDKVQADHELSIKIVHEDQPGVESAYRALTNGHADD